MNGLSATGITVRFGGHVALEHVHVDAPSRRITGLIGPNGAGKTTLFNVCCGFLTPAEGSVTLDGLDITGLTPAHRARLGLGRTFQRMELFRSITVRQNVEYAVEAANISADPLTQLGLVGGGPKVRVQVRRTADEILADTGLAAVADRLAGEITTGQGRLLELARALARQPTILLLDEPSSGLDPAESHQFGATLTRLVADRQIGVFMVEHDMNLVLTVCDHIHVLDFGRQLTSGSPADIRSSELVQAAYLGKRDLAEKK